MTATRAVFLDRDGTINKDTGYLCSIQEFSYLPGAKEALRRLQTAGYILVVITNQSGIGRGYYTEEDYKTLTAWMLSDLEASGIQIAAIYHCPHAPDEACSCRKPATGLFQQAVQTFGIQLENSFAVGDGIRDVCICHTSPCRGIVIYAQEEKIGEKISYIRGGLLDAASLILGGADAKLN